MKYKYSHLSPASGKVYVDEENDSVVVCYGTYHKIYTTRREGYEKFPLLPCYFERGVECEGVFGEEE